MATTLHDRDARPSVATQEREAVHVDPVITTPTPMVRYTPPADAGAKIGEPPRLEFTASQVDLIKRTIARGASDDEFKLFIYQCQRLRLDPFARQCYFMKRRRRDGNKWVDEYTFEVSIDGFRLTAERTGEYQGQTDPEWCDVQHNGDGTVSLVWYPVWPYDEPPHAARVGVYRRGFVKPLYAVARWNAYVQLVDEYGDDGQKTGEKVPNSMWEKRGPEQLAKCAEALALRQAFPNELSGVYTPDEMAQAGNDADEPEPVQHENRAPETRRETHKAAAPRPKRETKAERLAREERETQRARAEQAAQPMDPASTSRYGDLSFPFAPYKGLALDAMAGDEYAIPYDVLEKGENACRKVIAGEVPEMATLDAVKRAKWQALLAAIQKEQERRIAEHDETLNEATRPSATADTSGASDAIDTDACPTCHGQGGTVGTADNMDVIECPDCGGSGKVERGEAFEG
jgi:phage recombination protein Bet